MKIVGTSPNRLDSWGKVSGETDYVDDLQISGAWYGGTVRSPVVSGTIRRITFDQSFDWTSVVVVLPENIPGKNTVSMIMEDMPALAEKEVRYLNEPVALVAAPDKKTLSLALKAIDVDIEPSPPVLSIDEALLGKVILAQPDNIISAQDISHGDVEEGFRAADHIIEGSYSTGLQEQMYIETNGMIAFPRGGGAVEIVGSLQCPYYIHSALMIALDKPAEQVIIRQAATGGGFGGKEDFPSVLALHAALLAIKSGNPVRMIYGRREDILSTTKRHPARIHHRTAVDTKGKIIAAEIDVILDGGAYITLSPVVLSRAILHATNVYHIPNVEIRGRVVATNTPPNGAFRGFGAPQTIFGMERHMDRIAAELGLSPLDVRRINILRDGNQLPCGQVLPKSNAELVMDRALELSGYEHFQKDHEANGKLQGIGLSLCLHGGGFTGGGEEKIKGKVKVRSSGNGNVDILVSNVEMGQGAATVLPMITAETLGLPLENIRYLTPDTSIVPNSGPTVASRTTMIVGALIREACLDLLKNAEEKFAALNSLGVIELKWTSGELRQDGEVITTINQVLQRLEIAGEFPSGSAQYTAAKDSRWDEATHKGQAYKAYSWGANVIEVEVDPDTFEITPGKVTSVVEIGRAINPQLSEGQVDGGTVQALGYAYLEEMKSTNGKFDNDSMTTYIIPTAMDVSEMEVEILEVANDKGPFGAKGLGELAIDGAAPALAAAVENATGFAMRDIPMTPERILELSDIHDNEAK